MHLRPLHSLSRILLVTCAVGLGTTALFAQDTTIRRRRRLRIQRRLRLSPLKTSRRAALRRLRLPPLPLHLPLCKRLTLRGSIFLQAIRIWRPTVRSPSLVAT